MDLFEEVFVIRTHRLVVDDDPVFEARKNTYWVTASSEEASRLTVGEVTRYLDQTRRLLAHGRPDAIRPLRFYAWFDEHAAQLRISVSSAAKLPFGGAIRITSDPEIIARQLLASDSLDGIRWSELAENDDNDRNPPTRMEPLDVFVCELS